jgi:hypothetical protein
MLWILGAEFWWGTSTALQQLSRQGDPFKHRSDSSCAAVRPTIWAEEWFAIFHELGAQLDHEPRSLAILEKFDIALRRLTATSRKMNKIGI